MSAGLRLLAVIAERSSTTTFRLLEERFLVGDEELSVYNYIRNHFRRYGSLPSVETIEEDTGVSLPETPEPVDYYLDEVHNRYVYNQVREEFAELRESIKETDIPRIAESANKIRRVCIPFSGQQQELQTFSELVPQLQEEYQYHHELPGFSGIPTGWQFLDDETGGWQNGDLIYWVARPSVGKTYLLIHQARTAWMAGKSVLFVSMEMTLKQVGMRFASIHSSLNPDMVRKGKLSNFAKRKFDSALSSMGSGRFHLFAGNFKKNTDDLDILIQEIEPDVVYIDGSYLMKPSNAPYRAGRYESAAYVVDELKRIALMRNRPLVATTQFGRTAGKGGKEGSLESIGYTDTIGTHASIVLAIKEGKTLKKPIIELSYVDDEEGLSPQIVGYKDVSPYRHIELLKGREGESGEFGISYQFAPFSFSEVPVHVVLGEQEPQERPSMDYMV